MFINSAVSGQPAGGPAPGDGSGAIRSGLKRNGASEYMEKNEAGNAPAEAFVAEWMDAARGLWESMATLGADPPRPFGIPGKNQQEKMWKSWETGRKMVQSMTAWFSRPEAVEEMQKGLDAVPDLLTGLARRSMESHMELQRQWMDRAAMAGRDTRACGFGDIDQETFRFLRELYEKELRKFLEIPQLGLNRFHQEKFNRMVDRQTMFQTALAEFLHMFCLPIEKTTGVMQEKLEEMAETGELHDDIKNYYNLWVKILEGHYMTLLKSDEYTQVMDNTIASFVEYKAAREEFLCDMLRNLPVPTHRDMDALYKDLHVLKKKYRELSRKLDSRMSGEENA